MKLQTYISSFLLGIIFLGNLGCDPGDGEKDIVTQVEDEFSINMVEALGTERQLSLELKSVELEPCLNSTIDRAVVTQSNSVTLLLNGIIPASDCNPGLAPAFSVGNAGTLQNGTYDFMVTIRNTVENGGKLIVKSDQYEINMLSSYGIIIENELMYRIPANTIWGYYAYDNQQLIGDAPASFINDLEILTTPVNLKEGYYGHFNASNNEIELVNPPQKNHIGYFFYRFNGSENDLASLLENHRNNNAPESIEFVVYTAEGKVF
ncbi:MAG: hypothetical protein AAFZ15_23850 [Bacteroidota bacterium]